jgi:hypothetical protein
MQAEVSLAPERVERGMVGAAYTSKSWDNLRAALALHFAYCHLCRICGSLRVTPAMAAGVSDHIWTLEELIGA